MSTNIRGVEFVYKDKYNNLIIDLLNMVNIDFYDFYGKDSCEAFLSNGSSILKFEENDRILLDKIETTNPYYVFFLNLQAYPRGVSQNEIETYEDFLKSDCNFIILVSDGWCVEIYAKEEKLLLQFVKNAIALKGENITIKTDYDDGRTRMSV